MKILSFPRPRLNLPARRPEVRGTAALDSFSYSEPVARTPVLFESMRHQQAAKRRLIDQIVLVDNVDSKVGDTIKRDMLVFSLATLKLLRADAVRVVSLGPDQNLADTAWHQPADPARYSQTLERGNGVLKEAVQAVHRRFPSSAPEASAAERDLERYWTARELDKELTKELATAELDLRPLVLDEPVVLDELARADGVEQSEDFEAYRQAFLKLNDGLVSLDQGRVTAHEGVVLLPYPYYDGEAIAPERLAFARERSADRVERAIGLHHPGDRLVTLHHKFTLDPAPEVGHYRVSLHEVGHAIDHCLERRDGDAHRQRVDALYEQAVATGQLLTERAGDNVREYFAEAVEAYFTHQVGGPDDGYKTANNREKLAERQPELFAYLSSVLD